uniref:Odorant receptor n=1 Tax=Glossina pallidipes TaxID=7398 RepID=A0A1A9Z2D6_GLOPL
MIGVQVISGSEFWEFSKFLGFLLAAISQVYYVCLYGSLLLDYSGKIGDEMMSQEWYFADNRYQRMVILAIARSQRPAHLTAYKFFMISMESFANYCMQVIAYFYSYVQLNFNLYEHKKCMHRGRYQTAAAPAPAAGIRFIMRVFVVVIICDVAINV